MDLASRPDERGLVAALSLLFLAGAWATVAWCGAMSGGMPMPGGWTMSMAWMRMADQSWPQAAAGFMGMWIVMMVAMMTPALVPMLRHDRARAEARGESRLGARALFVGVGYFATWTLVGLATYPVGVAIATAEMRWPAASRAVPLAMGATLIAAGALQLTPWKLRQLALCRAGECGVGRGPDGAAARGLAGAWRQGLALGAGCVRCCLGPMLALLVLGVMDLGVMAAVAAAITAERLLPRPAPLARLAGLSLVVVGGWWILCRPS